MKIKNALVALLLVLVCAAGSGCVSCDIGGSSKAARIGPDGSFHENHSAWGISDPFTAIGKFLGGVSLNVDVVPDCYYPGSSGYYGNSGSYLDYRYNRWCANGYHIEQRGSGLWQVPNNPQLSQ